MKVLVTGASGFIGRRAVARLAQGRCFEVIAASRSRSADMPDNAIFEEIDLLSPGACAELVKRVRPTHLLHFAWNAQPGKFWTAADNLDWASSTLVLLRAFWDFGGHRAVLAGSCAEYDWNSSAVLSEDSATVPATFYGAIKDSTRRAACAAAFHLGGSLAWGRIFWLYGPGEARGRLVSDVAAALMEGRPAEVGEGWQERDFLHVDDVAGAFVAALKSDWQGPFNIGAGKTVSVREIVERLGEISGRPDLVRIGARPTPATDPKRLCADTRILNEKIGYSPQIHLADGFKQVLGL